jgi:hypothetical protein
MRSIRLEYEKEGEVGFYIVNCWDYGEPRDGDCEIVEASSHFQNLIGLDPQDVWSRLDLKGWKRR